MPDDPTTPTEASAPAAEQTQATAPEPEASTASPPADGGGDGEQVSAQAPSEEAGSTTPPETDPPGGEPETPAEPTTLAELAERHEWAAEALAARDAERENAGGQRREASLRREAGSREQTAQNTARLLTAWDELEPDERAKSAGWTYDLATANAAVEATKILGESVRQIYDVPADVVEKALSFRESENPDWGGYTKTLIDGAVATGIAAASISDVPEGSKLHGEIKAEVQRLLDGEISARKLEAMPKGEAPPATPASGGAPNGRKNMTDFKTPGELLDAAVSGEFAASS